jgi:glycerol-3-phosphate dehydrogenase
LKREIEQLALRHGILTSMTSLVAVDAALTLYGGKLTAYRATAEKVLKRIRSSLPGRRPSADTRRLALVPTDDLEPQVLL